MPIQDQTVLVKRIKDELIAKGKTFNTNCDAFEITGRVAWALRDQGARLIVKTPGQNGCTWTNGVRYSHDAIAFSDGWVDCLVSAGPPLNTNGPSWSWTAGPSTGPLAEPFDLDPTPLSVHEYVGGDNDTGICDRCGRPRADPVHAKDDPIHAGHSDTLAQKIVALEAKVRALEASIHSDALAQRIAALEAEVHALEAVSIKYGLSIALRTNNGHLLCAEGGGGNEVNATREIIGGWETFLVEKPL
jgi:hypothetical protein